MGAPKIRALLMPSHLNAPHSLLNLPSFLLGARTLHIPIIKSHLFSFSQSVAMNHISKRNLYTYITSFSNQI